jgi:hypothetical protein
MTTPQHDQLTRTLAREAEQFHGRGGTELEIGQVLARAGEIRRGRRMRASMLMAACVLAVAAPVGIVALDHDSARREPAPAAPVRRTLTLEGLPTGPVPRTGYAQGREWHDGAKQFTLAEGGSRVDEVVPLEAGYLVSTHDAEGRGSTRFLHLDGSPASPTWNSQGPLAVSPEGTLAAFLAPRGGVTVLDGRTGATTTLPAPVQDAFSYGMGGLEGKSCTDGDGCAVLATVTHRSRPPETWRVSSDGSRRQLPRIKLGRAVSRSGSVAGITVLRDDTSTCSEVQDAAGNRLWRTCEHTLSAFSPDGRHLLAAPAYLDGAGVRDLAVLDATTGRTVLGVQLTDRSLAGHWAWEDDQHVLVTVLEAGQWAVVRLGLDGSAEVAVPAVPGPEERPPFVLATR